LNSYEHDLEQDESLERNMDDQQNEHEHKMDDETQGHCERASS